MVLELPPTEWLLGDPGLWSVWWEQAQGEIHDVWFAAHGEGSMQRELALSVARRALWDTVGSKDSEPAALVELRRADQGLADARAARSADDSHANRRAAEQARVRLREATAGFSAWRDAAQVALSDRIAPIAVVPVQGADLGPRVVPVLFND